MKNEDRDTLPAMPEGAPEYARVLYDMMLHAYQDAVKRDRKQDARLLKLEAEVFGPSTPDSGFAEEDTDPGPRN